MGVFVGDVCGKGMNAAVATSQIRYTLRALSIIEPDPAAVLAGLHHALLLDPDTADHQYCTAVYARLRRQRETWTVTIAAGGHPPPLHLDATGTVTPIAVKGPAIGLFPGVSYSSTTVDLMPGEAILFYTDGITDLRIGHTVLGSGGLAERLTGVSADAQTIIGRLRSLAADIDQPRDDIAVLALSIPTTN